MAYIPAISSDRIVNGTIINDDINASANIALSKLATDPLARANHTGSQAHTTISDFDTGVQTNRLDQMAAPTAAVGFNSQQITGLAAGSASGHAVEYDQFNAALDGLSYKDAVDRKTTSGDGNLDLTGEETIDGTVTSTSRILVTEQTSDDENGVYTTGAGAWTRVSDMNTAAEIDDGTTVWVKGGTTHADTRWTQTATVATLETDSITWSQTGSATAVSALDDLSDVDLTGAADTAMLWNDNGTWKDTANATYDDDTGQMALSTTGSAAGILLGGDALLYRDGANVLRTPDALTVDASFTATGLVTTQGGIVKNTTAVNNAASPYAVAITDDIILVDASGGAVELDLPAASGQTGRIIGIKDQGGDALTNNITLDPNASENIEGASTSFVLDEDFMAVWIICDGTEWSVL